MNRTRASGHQGSCRFSLAGSFFQRIFKKTRLDCKKRGIFAVIYLHPLRHLPASVAANAERRRARNAGKFRQCQSKETQHPAMSAELIRAELEAQSAEPSASSTSSKGSSDSDACEGANRVLASSSHGILVRIVGPALLCQALTALLKERMPQVRVQTPGTSTRHAPSIAGPAAAATAATPAAAVGATGESAPFVLVVLIDSLLMDQQQEAGGQPPGYTGGVDAVTGIVWIIPESEAMRRPSTSPRLLETVLEQGYRRKGVRVFVSSEVAEPDDLCQAIDAAAQGRSYCSASLLPHLLSALEGKGRTTARRSAAAAVPAAEEEGEAKEEQRRAGARRKTRRFRSESKEDAAAAGGQEEGMLRLLTQREEEVARLAAAGLSAQEIAEQLSIRPNTVKAHLQTAYKKMHVRRRRELLAALENRQAQRTKVQEPAQAPAPADASSPEAASP